MRKHYLNHIRHRHVVSCSWRNIVSAATCASADHSSMGGLPASIHLSQTLWVMAIRVLALLMLCASLTDRVSVANPGVLLIYLSQVVCMQFYKCKGVWIASKWNMKTSKTKENGLKRIEKWAYWLNIRKTGMTQCLYELVSNYIFVYL